MSNDICWLISVLTGSDRTGDWLTRIAIKVDKEVLSGDCCEYPMEPENRSQLHALLPDHVRSMGPIVDVQEIFEISIIPEVTK